MDWNNLFLLSPGPQAVSALKARLGETEGVGGSDSTWAEVRRQRQREGGQVSSDGLIHNIHSVVEVKEELLESPKEGRS